MGLLAKVKTALRNGPSNTERSGEQAPDPNAMVAEGSRLLDLGKTGEALRCYEQALAINPKLALAQFNRGIALLDLGEAQLALGAFNAALTFKPNSAGTHYNLGNAHLALGNLVEAKAAYNTAISLKPDFADAIAALQAASEQLQESAQFYFLQAVASQDNNQLAEAESLYRQVLTLTPDHFQASNNLGGILLTKGCLEDAIFYFRQAASLSPENAEVCANLGNAYKFAERFGDAKLCFEKSTQLQPDNAATWLQLANTQTELQLYEDALKSYSRSIEINPTCAEAHLNTGIAFTALDDYPSAEACYLKAIELQPDSAEAHSNLGVVLKRVERFAEALHYFSSAIALKPGFAAAHLNSGTVLQALGEFDAAVIAYKTAMELDPDSAEAYLNYGTVLQQFGNLAEAEANYMKALSINPRNATTHSNLGVVYSHTGRMQDSVRHYRQAIDIKPNYAEAYANLGGVLKDLGKLEESQRTLIHALSIDPDCLTAHSSLLFINNYVAHLPVELLMSAARSYGESVLRRATPFTAWKNTALPERVLRIGIVSGDLSSHPVGFFLDGVLSALASRTNREFEIYAYACQSINDHTTDKLRASCTAWQCVVGLSDQALARKIHDDDVIDILIDLSGHTAKNRLPVFAWKPAPIQVSWLGYFATTGVAAMDYFIADPWTLPPEQDKSFTEQIWRLPETRLCFTPPDFSIDVNPLPAESRGFITFGSFNNLSKMNDEVVSVWARILTAIPTSQLFLKYQQLSDATIIKDTISRFALHGVTADRLILEGHAPRADYLASYHRVDIGLDPFPFPGGTTTAEALWMGVPVVTLAGDRFLSRQGVGLLANAGLADWIARDSDDYVDRAVAHAQQIQSLATLRSQLRPMVLASPIFDAPRFASHFEQALRSMWCQWCAKQ